MTIWGFCGWDVVDKNGTTFHECWKFKDFLEMSQSSEAVREYLSAELDKLEACDTASQTLYPMLYIGCLFSIFPVLDVIPRWNAETDFGHVKCVQMLIGGIVAFVDALNIGIFLSSCLILQDQPGVNDGEAGRGFIYLLVGYACGVISLFLKGIVPAVDLRDYRAAHPELAGKMSGSTSKGAADEDNPAADGASPEADEETTKSGPCSRC